MRSVLVVVAVVLLAACGSGLGQNTKAWCGQHLDAVAAEGARQGTTFELGAQTPITWPQYLASSPAEQALITAEADKGQAIWDGACKAALAAANPGVSPEPTQSPGS